MFPDLLACLPGKERAVAGLIGIDEGKLIVRPKKRPTICHESIIFSPGFGVRFLSDVLQIVGLFQVWANPSRKPKYGDTEKHVVRARRFFQVRHTAFAACLHCLRTGYDTAFATCFHCIGGNERCLCLVSPDKSFFAASFYVPFRAIRTETAFASSLRCTAHWLRHCLYAVLPLRWR